MVVVGLPFIAVVVDDDDEDASSEEECNNLRLWVCVVEEVAIRIL